MKEIIIIVLITFCTLFSNEVCAQNVKHIYSKCIKFTTMSRMPLTKKSINGRKKDNFLVFEKKQKNKKKVNEFYTAVKSLEKINSPLDDDIRAMIIIQFSNGSELIYYIDKSKSIISTDNQYYRLSKIDFETVSKYLSCNCFP